MFLTCSDIGAARHCGTCLAVLSGLDREGSGTGWTMVSLTLLSTVHHRPAAGCSSSRFEAGMVKHGCRGILQTWRLYTLL
jgi:hypothetical protein